MTAKRVLIFLVVMSVCFGCLSGVVFSEGVGDSFGVELFVATDGSDSNSGSIDAPFATIEKARDTIRAMGTLPEGGVAVNIRGGNYPVTKTLELKAEDSGTESSPIVYRSYNGEKVTFTGGKQLDTSKMKKVTDETLLNGLVEEDAREHLYSIDLKEQGVTMHELAPFGRGYNDYNPKQIYMNGTQFIEARWPNKDESQSLVICQPLTDGVDTTKYNGTNLPVKLVYPDSENRSSKWNIKYGDAYVGGAVVFFWAQVNLRIDNIDAVNKVATSIDASTYSLIPGAEWGQQYKVYFSNIFAEIDRPGEYYVDRETGIMYFYPVGDADNAEIFVSDAGYTNILADDLKYVTFKGIDFKYGRGISVYLRNGDNLRVEDCEFNGGSVGMKMIGCTNTVVWGNVFHNLNSDGLDIGSGDRENLTPTGNLVENNLFYNTSILRGGKYAIYLSGTVGDVIRNNEFNDLDMSAILMQNCNDIVIEYNKFKNCLLEGTDYGAIYWGRQVDSLGHVIRYNYFESIGSNQISKVLAGGDARSIFVDDGATGADVYGNVFFDGGVGATMFSTNGGEFHNIHSNVFIADDPDRINYDVQLNSWGNGGYTYKNNYIFTKTINENIPARVWLYHMAMRAPVVEQYGTNSESFTDEIKNLMWSSKWAEHYQGTWWQSPLEFYSKAYHDGAKAYHDAGDKDGLIKYLDNNLPAQVTNTINNNLLLGRTTFYEGMKASVSANYLGSDGSVSDSEKAMFVDYNGKNFELTEEGLAKVKAQAPDFQQIPFENIGLLTNVGGRRPTAEVSDSVILGFAFAGNRIMADYEFVDPDGDEESVTKVYWYVSDSQNGSYTMAPGAEGKMFRLPSGYAGRFVKYEIVPYDTNGLRGDSVWSSPILVEASAVDTYALNEAILKAEMILKAAEPGQYSQEAIGELRNALDIAKAAIVNKNITQSQADGEALALDMAIMNFTEIKNNNYINDLYYDVLYEQRNWTSNENEIIGTNLSESDAVDKTGYVKIGGNICYLKCANAALETAWLAPVGHNKVSDSFTGEYIVGNKVRYDNYPYYDSTGSVGTYLTYDNSDLNKSYFGFETGWDTTGKASVGFRYRYMDTVDTAINVGALDFVSGEWYTYRAVYNLDNKTADLYIYNSAGVETAHFSHEIQSSVNGTEIPYKDLTTSSVCVKSKNRGAVYLDNYVFAKATVKPVTAEFDSDLVSVTYDGKPVESGVPTLVPYNSDAVFTISAKDGYAVKKITVDGNAITDKEQVVFAGVNSDHTFSVSVKEKEEEDDYLEILYETDFSEHESEIVGTDLTHGNLTQLASGYVKSGNEIYFYQCSNSSLLSKWISPVGYNKVSDNFSGEFVINTKAMYANYGNYASTGKVGAYVTYDNRDLSKSFIGYDVSWDTAGKASVSFRYRYGNTVDTALSVGTFDFVSGEWYTYKAVYNFDNMTADLHVLNSAGTEVASFTHELQSTVNGTAIPYRDVTTSSIYTESKTRGLVYVGDYVFGKITAKPVTATFDSDCVSVTYGGQAVASGVATPVTYGEDAVFTVEPIGDNVITGITVDGEAVASKTQVTIPAVKEAHTFSVAVKGDEYYTKLYSTDNSDHESEIVGTDLTHGNLTSLASGYVKSGNEIYLYQCSNAAQLTKWFPAPIEQTVSSDFSGEYIVDSEIMYANYGSYASSGQVGTYATYDSKDMNKSYIGFNIAWDNSGSSTVTFAYRYGNTVDTAVNVGTWNFVSGAWYTYRSVYNLDNMTADLYVLNSDGTEAAHFSHNIQSEVNGTVIPYKDFTPMKIYTASKNRGLVYIGKSSISQTKSKAVTVNYDSAKGTVTCNGNPVVSGEKIPVPYNSAEAQVFSIAANEGFEITDVTVGGVSNSVIDSYDFRGITADQTMTVVFEAEAPAQPEVIFGSYTPATNYPYTKDGVSKVAPYSVIIYGKVTGAPYEYGFKLSGGNLTETYKLAHAGMVTPGGGFAIRVVGDVLTANTYTATPFVVINNGDADTDSAAQTIEIK